MANDSIRINNKEYSKNSILRVGRDLASIWGGECFNFSVDEELKEVNFDCIEAGEEFAVTQTFNEMTEQLKSYE